MHTLNAETTYSGTLQVGFVRYPEGTALGFDCSKDRNACPPKREKTPPPLSHTHTHTHTHTNFFYLNTEEISLPYIMCFIGKIEDVVREFLQMPLFFMDYVVPETDIIICRM